ncbi:MAG: rod shape-determining protein MreC [Pedosphaera sp.]|nr:rod shape-determining protein MreC [Pedosphaera sp.]MSU42483.1 rod shape-determining protein MreC [Pedosphaera sp.]
MRRRSYQFAAGIVLALSLILLSLPAPTAARLKGALTHSFAPLFGMQHGLQKLSGTAVDHALPRAALLRELDALARTNQLLRIQVDQLRGAGVENIRLRAQLNLKQRPNSPLKLARVIGRDPANWWRAITIDLGSNDGLQPDQPVWVAAGLVGRVYQVGPNQSQVSLVGDPACRVSVKVRETGENGILTAGPFTTFDPKIVHLHHLSADTESAPEHTVVTSGLGEIFPPDIPVGTIVEVDRNLSTLQTTARVKLAVDASKLFEVWVMVATDKRAMNTP